jgi:hypothetical protein
MSNPKSHSLINEVVDGKIICTKCNQWFLPEEFPKASRMKRGRHSWHNGCFRLYNQQKTASLTEEQRQTRNAKRRINGAATSRRYRQLRPEVDRGASLKYRYGLTLSQYEVMVERQHGLCAICGLPPRGQG